MDTTKNRYSTELEDFFKENVVEIKLFPDESIKTFKNAKTFHNYILGESEFWSKYAHIDNLTRQINSGYGNCVSNFNSALNGNVQIMRSLVNSLNNLFSSQSSVGKKFFSISQTNTKVAIEFLRCFNNQTQNDIVDGQLLASLFRNKLKLADQPKDYDVQMGDLLEKHNELYKDANEEFLELQNKLSAEYKNKVSELNQQYNDISNVQDENIKKRNEEFNNLEQLYKNQLQLEAPAKYWKEASKKHEKNGRKWIWITIGISIVFVGTLYSMLLNLPDISNNDGDMTLKITIIFMLIVAVGVFLLTLFAKLATSSYHLARDADERHKLVYVYLALLKDSSVEQEDRNIVLQSIFARSDTGLLRGGSNANNPTSAIQFILDTTKQSSK